MWQKKWFLNDLLMDFVGIGKLQKNAYSKATKIHYEPCIFFYFHTSMSSSFWYLLVFGLKWIMLLAMVKMVWKNFLKILFEFLYIQEIKVIGIRGSHKSIGIKASNRCSRVSTVFRVLSKKIWLPYGSFQRFQTVTHPSIAFEIESVICNV